MVLGVENTDDDIITAVTALYQNPDNRDPAEGGVHYSLLAERLDIHESTAQDRLRGLADDGAIIRQDGLDPETLRWRRSYAPLEVAGDGLPEPDSRTLR